MVPNMSGTLLYGPGPNRWPGSPTQKPVESGNNPTMPLVTSAPARPSMDRRSEFARHKVVVSVQMAALMFSKDEIRTIVENALSRIKARDENR